ncbi:MAG: helix-turn-helix domain-containing protein [Thiomargarita sp.]|nr:helix-turn-helix domain-containing protein [Thiomargarita sp.]
MKAKSVKLYPNQKQKQTFKTWHNCSRYVFNQTIDYIRSCVNFSPSWIDIKKDLLKQFSRIKFFEEKLYPRNQNGVTRYLFKLKELL